MAFIQKFLGKTVEIPEDRHYCSKQGLWGRQEDRTIVFGLTQPALVLMGGIKDIDWLLEEGQMVQADESVAFAITGKILYIDTPIAGEVYYNKITAGNPTQINADPYGQGWLFLIKPGGDIATAYRSLVSDESYIETLRGTHNGKKNPGWYGLKSWPKRKAACCVTSPSPHSRRSSRDSKPEHSLGKW